MTRSLRLLVVLVVISWVLPSAAEAQRGRGRARGRGAVAPAGPKFGPHLGYNFDVEELALGAQLVLPVTPRLSLYPSFDYYFVASGALVGFNVDLKVRPPARYGFFYMGGGLNLTRAGGAGTSNTETGLNILAGLEGRYGPSTPFVETRLTLDGGSAFQIVGGLNFRLR